jgi:hypothetical protein
VPTINSTPGDPSQNSYCSLAEADAYHASRLFNDAWTSADPDAVKTPALLWACRTLDRQDWQGLRTNKVQGLRWPRYYVADQDGWMFAATEIPTFLKNAQAELAFLFIQQDRTSEVGTEGFSEIKAGEIDVKVDKYDRIDTISKEVWSMIAPFCNTGVELMRG